MKLKLISNVIVSMALLSVNLHAEQGEDPYVNGKAAKPVKEASRPRLYTHSIVFELFSISTQEASAMVRDGLSDKAMYAMLVEKGKQESIAVIRSRPGETVTSNSVQEVIYPTEFVPAKTPHTICLGHDQSADQKQESGEKQKDNEAKKTIDLKNLTSLVVPATASAFATRHAGLGLRIQATPSDDGSVFDLQVDAEFVSHVGDFEYGQGVSLATLPDFETQFIKLAVTSYANEPFLLGTMSRPPFSKKGKGLSESVWFAMITVKPIN